TSGYGVQGTNSGVNGGTGVYGSGYYGTYGQSANGVTGAGVYGSDSSASGGSGVYGTGFYGVQGQSSSGYGVSGAGPTAVFCLSPGGGYGVWAQSATTAVYGVSTGGSIGVLGTTGGNGQGVVGSNTGSGSGSGVEGSINSALGYGVYGLNTSTTGG